MYRITFLSIMLMTVFSVSAQQTETRQLPSFKQIHVSEGIEVTISKGDKESAKLEVDGIELTEVLTEVSGGTLRIHLDGSNHRNVEVEVFVTYVNLDGLKASSAGSIKGLDIIKSLGDFEIDVSSAGDIDVMLETTDLEIEASSAGDVDLEVVARSIDVDVSSAGDVYIEGRAEEVEIEVSSSGEFSGYSLNCETAELRASSGGSIKISVSREIEARASSGGSIRYKGDPRNVDKETSSGGSIRRD